MGRSNGILGFNLKIKRYYKHFKGSAIEYNLTPYESILNKINKLKTEFEGMSDDRLRTFSCELAEKARDNECINDFLVEGFAAVREAIWRVLKINVFDEQIIGGIAIHRGKLAEMQTGEGKTITAVFPAYLNALSGKGVHVLTFNDYLARRDARWMGGVYEYLSLSVGYIQEGMPAGDRQRAYHSDITYLTAKESGFDYLRDGLCYHPKDRVHRDFHFAVIDEADSIMIDEARVPLIIAGTSDDYIEDTSAVVRVVQRLEEKSDFEFDDYYRNIFLTEHGIQRAEEMLNCGNLYSEENIELLARLNHALHAEYLLQADRDYIVRNGMVELVDEFTGRVADRRRWPDGLQAAVEAKESLAARSRGRVLNSITLQNFLRLYPKISGMTATAQKAEEEFREFYNLAIVVIPPHKLCIRQDFDDVIFRTKKEKNKVLIDEIIGLHKRRQPVLVGTGSVRESAHLALALRKRGVACKVLNAKRDEFEARIVSGAGMLGAVTISTNMAGRGTDIKLGGSNEQRMKQVIELGGLYVIGTNKHESGRIDDQLRGRAGRQGDPGSSRFFISIEDEIFVRYRLREIIGSYIDPGTGAGEIDNPFIKKMIDHIQRVIEGQNLEIKKTLCNYSSLIEKQRVIMFEKRQDILNNNVVVDAFKLKASALFDRLTGSIGAEEVLKVCRHISLIVLDKSWADYLADVADIQKSIYLERIGGREPVYAFYKRSIDMFDSMLRNLEFERTRLFESIDPNDGLVDLNDVRFKAPSATWTYLVNDNPFEGGMGLRMLVDMGFNAMAGLLWPLIALYPFLKKLARKKLVTYGAIPPASEIKNGQ